MKNAQVQATPTPTKAPVKSRFIAFIILRAGCQALPEKKAAPPRSVAVWTSLFILMEVSFDNVFFNSLKRVCPMKTPRKSPRPTVMKKAAELEERLRLPATIEAVCQPAPAGKILETATSTELDRRFPTYARAPSSPLLEHDGWRLETPSVGDARRILKSSAGNGANAKQLCAVMPSTSR